MLPVIVMPEAEESMRRNARWWAKHRSQEQPQRWYDGLRDALVQWATIPANGL
jgi:hypothetical protein